MNVLLNQLVLHIFCQEEMKRIALVCGAGGFIGGHLVKRLKAEGFWVRGVDLVYPQFSPTKADDFHNRRFKRPANMP